MERYPLPCQLHPVSIVEDWSFFNVYLKEQKPDKVILLVDSNTFEHCYPVWEEKSNTIVDLIVEVNPGEEFKSISVAEHIWSELHKLKASRHSLLICLGGGVITDLGGFCASVYKRGIKCIHIPTTLLAQVDAAIGGKTGVDHEYLKNVIGTFYLPQEVFLDRSFLASLPERQVRNGMAEVIKHALIQDVELWEELKNIDIPGRPLLIENQLLARAVEIKCRIVDSDPKEKGLRKILNFGHTFGHGIESLLLEKGFDILHGEAIGAGMEMETLLSLKNAGLPFKQYSEIITYIRKFYPRLPIEEGDINEILNRMTHDKKNKNHQISFSLLKNIGEAGFDYLTEDFDLLRDIIRAYIKKA